jgi:hypothetical protein
VRGDRFAQKHRAGDGRLDGPDSRHPEQRPSEKKAVLHLPHFAAQDLNPNSEIGTADFANDTDGKKIYHRRLGNEPRQQRLAAMPSISALSASSVVLTSGFGLKAVSPSGELFIIQRFF